MKFYRDTVEIRPKVRRDGRSILNLNSRLVEAVKKSGIRNGFLIVRSLHTTAALIGQEDELGILGHDLSRLLDSLVKKNLYYRHDDFKKRRPTVRSDEHKNAKAHLEYLLVGHSSIILDVYDYKIDFGTWFSILFIDFDPVGRMSRRIAITVWGE